MKFIYFVCVLLLVAACKKNKEDQNPVVLFTPSDGFTYTNQDTTPITISSISTRPISNIDLHLVVDKLNKDSVLANFSGNETLELQDLKDTLRLNVNWPDSLSMQLKVVVTDEDQTKTYVHQGLYLEQEYLITDSVFQGFIFHANNATQPNGFNISNLTTEKYTSSNTTISFMDNSFLSPDSLSQQWVSPAQLGMVKSSTDFDKITQKSIQTSYYNGTKVDTVSNITTSNVIFIMEELNDKKYFTAVKITALDTTNTDATLDNYKIAVKQFIK